MPPSRSRRPTTRSAATPNQSTLSFNSKSRVTKPSISSDTQAKKAQSKAADIEIETEVEPQTATIEALDDDDVEADAEDQQDDNEAKADISTTTVEAPSPASKLKHAKRSKPKSTDAAANSPDILASKITDARIKKYWQAEEDARLAPRVHQSLLPTSEKILRHFDLSTQYGPCIGIPRLARWRRAHTLNLSPPIEVLAVLLKEEQKGADRGLGGRRCGKMAYVDELGGGRGVVGVVE